MIFILRFVTQYATKFSLYALEFLHFSVVLTCKNMSESIQFTHVKHLNVQLQWQPNEGKDQRIILCLLSINRYKNYVAVPQSIFKKLEKLADSLFMGKLSFKNGTKLKSMLLGTSTFKRFVRCAMTCKACCKVCYCYLPNNPCIDMCV